jgi:Uma2 family endonuclease
MNVQLEPRMDKPEFLTWVQAHEGRYELVGNRVVMMTGGSRGHAILVRRLAAALEKRLDSTRWTVLTSDFGVDVEPSTIRYPDVVVDAVGGRFKDLTATAPVLIAEVISPSSAKDDFGAKRKNTFDCRACRRISCLRRTSRERVCGRAAPRDFRRSPRFSMGTMP